MTEPTDEGRTPEEAPDEAPEEAPEEATEGATEPAREPVPEEAPEEAREKAARKRRLAEIFGDVLPEQTSDDADPGGDRSSSDDWLRRQVPPHHGS